MGEVKETICSSCIHLNVCKYKNELLETVKHLDEYQANSRFSYSLKCSDYQLRTGERPYKIIF